MNIIKLLKPSYNLLWNKTSLKVASKAFISFSVARYVFNFLHQYTLPKFSEIFEPYSVLSALASTNISKDTNPLNSISDIVETMKPSIVQIISSNNYGPISSGSGCIAEESGYVLTCFHVVQNASTISIELADGKTFPAEIVIMDPDLDITILKFDPGDYKLKPVVITDATTHRAGEFVISFGHPISSYCVSTGVISDPDHNFRKDTNKYVTFLLSNVCVEKGYSGGALVNLKGEVIGVNAISILDINLLAAPGYRCRQLLEIALNKGSSQSRDKYFRDIQKSFQDINKIKYSGVILGSISPSLVTELSLIHPEYSITPQYGVVVHSVFKTSIFTNNELIPDDIVESVNGIVLHAPSEFMNLVTQSEDSLDIAVIRKGKKIMFKNTRRECALA